MNQRDGKGYTALMYASNEDVVKMLLESGADVNQKAESAFTKSYKDYMRCLGKDGNECLNDGTTALFHARYENFVETFLAAGANVNEKDCNGETALF